MIDIKVLEEILRSLRIIKEYISDRNKIIEPVLSEEILIAPILVVYNKTTQTVM